jgi:hypothetical protein
MGVARSGSGGERDHGFWEYVASGLLVADDDVRDLLWPMSGADLLRHRSGDSAPALATMEWARGRADS